MRQRMKSNLTKLMVIPICLIVMIMLAVPVQAWSDNVTPAQINAAIDDGLEYLAAQQYAGGYWGSTDRVGTTGLAVLKFETHAVFMGISPFDPAYEYSDNVAAGLKYIFSMTSNVTSSNQTYIGDPDSNGNGILVRAYEVLSHEIYETAIALMAICASNEPDRIVSGSGKQDGRKFKDVAQDIVDYLAWGQNEAGGGIHRGGWRYRANHGDSDNSISGYATIGLAYAEAPAPWGFSLTIPPGVFTELALWLTKIQDTQDGDIWGYDGGSWYGTGYWDWINTLKTGNLLSEFALVGYGPAHDNVTQAIDYMERHWLDPDRSGEDSSARQGWYGLNQGGPDYQTCFTMMKGYQAMGIETITVDNGTDNLTVDWYKEMATRLVEIQNPDGSWSTGGYWGTTVQRTAWAMLALEKAAPPALAVLPPFDVNEPGKEHTVKAVYKIAGVPQENVEIEFEIISGPNDDEPIASDNTNASGEAYFTYTGDGGTGTDIIKATAVQSGLVGFAEKVWEEGELPVEVGGEVYPVNKLGLLAPWIALSALLIPAIIVMRRRRARS